jgi:phi LC3 family holin
MKINWNVRIKNKVFWMSIIPALIILIQAVANVFGFTITLDDLSGDLLAVVEALFIVLTILGIVADPTTEGMTDSEQAMTYTEPKR